MKLTLKDEVLRVIEEKVGETCDEIREKPLFRDEKKKSIWKRIKMFI